MSFLWKNICPCTCCGFCNVSGKRMWSKRNRFLSDGAPDSGQQLLESRLKHRETWKKKTQSQKLTWPGHVCESFVILKKNWIYKHFSSSVFALNSKDWSRDRVCIIAPDFVPICEFGVWKHQQQKGKFNRHTWNSADSLVYFWTLQL